jgi:hypothetical protein
MLSTEYATPGPLDPTPREAYVPGRPGYKVDEIGRVFSCRRPAPGGLRVWRPLSYWKQTTRSGDAKRTRTLWCCNLERGADEHGKSAFEVRELVALAFLGPRPEGKYLYSLDKDSLNHRLSNLAYLTRSEAWERGLIGNKRNPTVGFCNCILTPERATAIRADYHDRGMYICDVAKKWGLSIPMTRAVLTRKTWDKVADGYPPLKAGGRKKPRAVGLTPEERLDIARQAVAGRHYRAIWRGGYMGKVKEGSVKTAWYLARKAAGLVTPSPGSGRRSSTTADSTTRPTESSACSPTETGTTTSSTPAPGA